MKICNLKYTVHDALWTVRTVMDQLLAAGVPEDKAFRMAASEDSFELYTYIQEHPTMVFSEWLVKNVQPQKTWLNNVGEFFVRGTECRCCMGYRIAIALALCPVFYILGRLV